MIRSQIAGNEDTDPSSQLTSTAVPTPSPLVWFFEMRLTAGLWQKAVEAVLDGP